MLTNEQIAEEPTAEEVIGAAEGNKMVTLDANVILDDWAYRILVKKIRSQATHITALEAKLGEVRTYIGDLETAAADSIHVRSIEKRRIARELNAILEEPK